MSDSTNKTYLVIAVIALIVSGVALTKSFTLDGNVSAQDSLIADLAAQVDQLGVDTDSQLSELNDSINDVQQTIDKTQQDIDAEIDEVMGSLHDYEAPMSLIQEMALSGLEEAATIVAVQSTIDMIDTAGFHDMATNIANDEISSRYLDTVQNVLAAIDLVSWPNALLKEVDTLRSPLSDLAVALSDNNVEDAKESSSEVHHTQHDLSNGVYEWLSAQEKADWIYEVDHLGGALAVVRVQSAVDMIDNVGYHGIATSIADGEISSQYLGQVRDTIYVVRSLPWPSEVVEETKTFLTDLQGLEAALAANDLESAIETSDAAHGSQHDLSSEAFEWLSEQEGEMTLFHEGKMGSMITMISVQSAVDFIGSIGTHAMATSIADGEIGSRYLGTVNKGLAIVGSTAWPEELVSKSNDFKEALIYFSEALEVNDLEACMETSELAHETDHDLRGAANDWLVANTDSSSADGGDGHGEESAEGLTIQASDWGFSMGHNAPVELIVTMGEPVELTVVNVGNMPHGIWSQDLNINTDVRAGQTVVISFTPEEVGEFTFFCNDPQCGTTEQHVSMTGTIIVTSSH